MIVVFNFLLFLCEKFGFEITQYISISHSFPPFTYLSKSVVFEKFFILCGHTQMECFLYCRKIGVCMYTSNKLVAPLIIWGGVNQVRKYNHILRSLCDILYYLSVYILKQCIIIILLYWK